MRIIKYLSSLMKKIITLSSMALAIGALFFSCSKTELEVTTLPETRAIEEEDISPRFTSNNLTYSEAQAFVQPFLERDNEMNFEKIFGREADYYIQYNGSFDVRNGGDVLGFRGIQCSAIRPAGKPFIVFSSRPGWSQDINSLDQASKPYEDIYETTADGRSVRVGRAYKYETNCRSECWILVSETSVAQFESIIGW